MIKFEKPVGSSRKEMIAFLENHFRYNTANPWNQSTSYANCVKVDEIGLTNEQVDKLLDIIGIEGAYDEVNDLLNDFACSHGWKWQVGFNGKSGGYLVLYQGGWKYSEYKSFCPKCGQKNYRTIEETGKKCGRCGQETRMNYIVPPREIFSYPGKPVDMNEDFEDWSDEMLADRVKLVTEFDRLCDQVIAIAANMADNYVIEEEKVYVPQVVKKLVRA